MAARRAAWGQLPADWDSYGVLVATPDCRYLGQEGWIVTNAGAAKALVVDCAQERHRSAMLASGLVDANLAAVAKGWLMLGRRGVVSQPAAGRDSLAAGKRKVFVMCR